MAAAVLTREEMSLLLMVKVRALSCACPWMVRSVASVVASST